MKRSIELAPGHSWLGNSLGNVLVEQQRLDEALDAYLHCQILNPKAADALSNLGSLYCKRGRLEQAEHACRQAVGLAPERAIGWFNLEGVLIELGEIHQGLLANSKAVALSPSDQTGRYRVAHALVQLGEIAGAAAVYRDWLADEPDNELVRQHLAACEGDVSHVRAPDGYVDTVFDSFAISFDAKFARLDYRAPQMFAELLELLLPAPDRQFRVLDVGCGTGLCGSVARGWAAHLADVTCPRACCGSQASAGFTTISRRRSW